jgi:hypothetical protein
MYYKDYWPKMPDGEDFDGKHLLTLVCNGQSPFEQVWNINLLIQEIESHLRTTVVDIPVVYSGSNNYVSRYSPHDFMLRPVRFRAFISSFLIDQISLPVWLAAMSTCQSTMVSLWMYKFLRSSLKQLCTDSYGQSLTFLLHASFIPEFQCRPLTLHSKFLGTSWVVDSFYSKKQKETVMFGKCSTQKRRCV